MANPTYISVILCTYNDENYIRASVESILSQSYPHFELIIVNDGSKDKTIEIIRQFDDERIRIVDKPNTGLADSLNVGIRNARYDWIARMDGDDIALPNRFEEQIKMTKRGFAVIGGQFFMIDENTEYVSKEPSRNPLTPKRSKFYIMMGWNPLAHPTALINKEVLLSVGGYDANFKASQDMDLWFRIGRRHKIINIKEPVLLYRKHSGNISSSRKNIQIGMAFMAFVKRALGIEGCLSAESFQKLQSSTPVAKYLKNNIRFVQKIGDMKFPLKEVGVFSYYSWRFCTYIKLYMNRKSIKQYIKE